MHPNAAESGVALHVLVSISVSATMLAGHAHPTYAYQKSSFAQNNNLHLQRNESFIRASIVAIQTNTALRVIILNFSHFAGCHRPIARSA